MKIIKRIIKILLFIFVVLIIFCGLILVFLSYNSRTNHKVDTASITCKDNFIRINQDCIAKRQIHDDILAYFKKIETQSKINAWSKEDIETYIGPIFNKYISLKNSYEAVIAFDHSVGTKVQAHNEWDLRLLLNIMHYHDHHGEAVYAEFSEGLRDYIIPFIEFKTDIVIKVTKDKNQLNRKMISSAFYQFIDPFSIDSNSGEITDSRFNPKHQKLMKILKHEDLF